MAPSTHGESGDNALSATEAAVLRSQARALEEEIALLRRKLNDAPKRVRTLEERLLETKGQLAQAVSQNEKLTYTLREAREHIAALREEVDKLTQPPSAYGTYIGRNEDGTVDVHAGGRKMRVSLHPDLDEVELERGSEVVLNESFNVILARGAEKSGEVVTLQEVMEDGERALITGRADEEKVVELATHLRDVKLRSGDHLQGVVLASQGHDGVARAGNASIDDDLEHIGREKESDVRTDGQGRGDEHEVSMP